MPPRLPIRARRHAIGVCLSESVGEAVRYGSVAQNGTQAAPQPSLSMLPDRHAEASKLHLRRALLFAALGYVYVAGVLALVVGVIILFARLGLGSAAGYLLGGIVSYGVIALLVGFAPPDGRRVTRDECPELFRAIDRARAELRAPAVDDVFLTHEMNAAVMERPRFGIAGWNQRFLLVGLPLVHALSGDELRAILAHEFAHLSRQHVRSVRMLARAAASWEVLVTGFSASWASFLFVPFFRWYTPRLEALTQQTSRAHELESDRLSARVAGAPVAARALLRLVLWNERMDRVVWPSVLRASLEVDRPRAEDFARALEALREPLGRDEVERGVRAALRDRTLDNHSHPSLADRLEALRVDPAEVERALVAACAEPGAAALLGANGPALAAEVGAAWAQAAEPLWRRCHLDARIWTEAERSAEVSPAAEWAHARWAAHCEPPEVAVPLLRRVPDRTEARVLLGVLLLREDDRAGQDEALRILEAEARRETAFAQAANEALEQFYARVGWPRDLRRCRERRTELRMAEIRTLLDRGRITAGDTLRPYAVPHATREALAATLREFPEVRSAWLVQKRLRGVEDALSVALALDVEVPWYRSSSGNAVRELCIRIYAAVQLPEPLDVVFPVDRGSRVRRRLRGIPGAEVYRRGGHPAIPATPAGWSSPSAWQHIPLPRGAAAAAVVLVMGAGAVAALSSKLSTPEERAAELPALRRAAREHPGDPGAARDLAWALVETERWDEARPALETAVRLNWDDAYLRNSLGWLLNQRGEYEKSIPYLRDAVKIDPRHPDAHHNLGWAFLKLERYHEAETAYGQAVRVTPQKAGAHSELGWVLLHLNRLDEAEKALAESVRLDPSSAWTHRVLARVHKMRSNLRGAVASYRQAARLEPGDAETWAEIGVLEHLLGNFPESAAAFENARFVDPMYFRRDEYRRAIWEASKAGRMYEPPES